MVELLIWLLFIVSVVGIYRLVIYLRKTPRERWQEKYDSKLKKSLDFTP